MLICKFTKILLKQEIKIIPIRKHQLIPIIISFLKSKIKLSQIRYFMIISKIALAFTAANLKIKLINQNKEFLFKIFYLEQHLNKWMMISYL
jgi:hypothetical protein